MVVDARSGPFAEREQLAKAMCDRHFGVGADGLLFVEQGKLAPHRMRMLNPDGSESEMCGNGLRCITRWLIDAGAYSLGEEIAVETGGRVVRVLAVDAHRFAVQMGEVRVVSEILRVQGFEGLLVNVGNPHFVVFGGDPWQIDLAEVGPRLERDPAFPDRANIHFATVSGPDEITQRTWERGAGMTLACGSGATAGAVAASHIGLTSHPVRVRLPGGDLQIDMDEAGHATMTGKAEVSFIGRWES